MTAEQVAVTRTPVCMRGYALAVVRAWRLVSDLWAQYMIETGGSACWNWNVGNRKAVDGQPFYCLRGTWEGVAPAEAQRLIASGEASADPSADHAHAVGPGRVSVVFEPPHPATRFRAYASLDEAMAEHLVSLAKRRYASAWPAVLAGDVDAFASKLRERGYFTASAQAYANGMRPAFRMFVESDAFG